MTKLKAAPRVALMALACMALVQGVALAADPIRITKPIDATMADLDPLRTWAAPFLLVHPDNPDIIVAGMHEFRDKTCGLMRSTDGGTTWTILDRLANPTSYPFCLANNSNIFQAPIAFGRDNRLYMGMAAWDTNDTRTKSSIAVARSDDLGDTWTSVVVHDARLAQDPDRFSLRPVTGLVVDTKTGSEDIVYVSYRLQYQGQPSGSARPVEPTVAVSRDSGATFTPYSALAGAFDDPSVVAAQLAAGNAPATNNNDPGTFGATPTDPRNFGSSTNGQGMTIDGDGNVYVAWPSQVLNGVLTNQPRGVFISKSTDQGQTWSPVQVSQFSTENRGNTRIAWTPDGGSNGTLLLVWERSPLPEMNAFSDVVISRSTDSGATWSEPLSLTQGNAEQSLSGAYLPNAVVAPNGRVDVVWWDTRDDPGIRANDVYYSYSEDAGVTWSRNIRVTDQTIDRRFGVWGNNFDQNSPPSLASTNQYALIAWDDTRHSRGEDGPVMASDPIISGEGIGGGVQDVYISAVQFEAIGGGTSSAAKAALAAVIGLVAVGLVLLAVAGTGRGRGGASGSSKPAKEAKPKTSIN